jgi:hypothetical protein
VKGILLLKGFLLLVLLISGCVDSAAKITPDAPLNSILIYVDEDPEEVQNLNKIHIANVVVSEGNLELIVLEEHDEVGRLRAAIIEIGAKETLPLTIEKVEELEGERVFVLGERPITPEEPEYIYAVEEELLQYGFSGEVR